ncbi:MAG: uroporphyrinogen-III synthase [Candidatus Omnitrophica bacterium]|nr:uroporphyrinogen-III synthase [Candidatus Omnitrophota bacterium]
MSLKNLNVVSFESRLSKTMGDLIKLNGGNPILAPAMKEVPLENNPAAFDFAEKVLKGDFDMAIFLTGVGTKALMAAIETRFRREDILNAFRKIEIVVRGPKPTRVLNEWNVPIHVSAPEPNTWREILNALDANREKYPVKNRHVALQEYGVPNPELVEGLRERGAQVTTVPVYRWALPDDTKPLKEAIQMLCAGKADVVIFTTAVQIHHALQVAAEMNKVDSLKKAFSKTVIASVGPDCSQALRSYGIAVDIEPQHPKMGPLVTETAQKAHTILLSKRSKEST